jgi:predicted ester cyclase
MTTAISEDLRARRSEIVKQHIDAENRHDPDGVVASFDQPNYDIPSFGDAGQVNGPEAVRELWQGLVAGFPDLHIEPGRHLHTDDAVFVEVVFSGTQQGEWAGIPATGRLDQCPHRLPV